MWIGGFLSGAIFMTPEYTLNEIDINLLDQVLLHRNNLTTHLNWVCIFA